MLGKRESQRTLFDVGNVFDLSLNQRSFHYQLAVAAEKLFKDEDFGDFYDDGLGRRSVPPSLLALTIILQNEAGVSDDEAIQRTAYDLRWAAVLRRHAGQPLCAKSTLQLFRSHLVLHDRVLRIFLSSINEAKRAGLLKGKALQIAVDTKPIRGRGAVEDTYNLLATGIRQLAGALALEHRQDRQDWMMQNGLARYTEPSIKGSADIDWSDEQARNTLLAGIVADARRLLSVCTDGPKVTEAAELLRKLLLQDVDESPSDGTGVQTKRSIAKDRVPSATDPEQRHGHKSKSNKFTGHKASVAVDVESQLIVGVDVLPGNAADAAGVLDLIEQVETETGMPVAETIGDCAYGSGEIRRNCEDAGRSLIAKVPQETKRADVIAKSAFKIDLDAFSVTCPMGHTSTKFYKRNDGTSQFVFGTLCTGCSLRGSCTRAKYGRGITVHPQEGLLASARAYQATPEGRAHLRKRVVAEHRLARLSQLGMSQARYRGRAKTRFQLVIAATIANFRRVWNWESSRERANSPVSGHQGSSVGTLGNVTGLAWSMIRRLPYTLARWSASTTYSAQFRSAV